MEFLDLPLYHIFDNIAKYLRIFDLLKFRSCSKLCKELADQGLEKHKRLCLYYGNCSKMTLNLIIQKCRNLHQILIDGIELSNEELKSLIDNNPHLERVDFGSYSEWCSEEQLRYLVAHCKKLKSLTTGDCSDLVLEEIGRNNNCIEEIDFGESWISARGFISFINQQPLLRYISLPWMLTIYKSQCTAVLMAISSVCKNLEYLCIWDFKDNPSQLPLIQLAKECPKLKIINLPDNFNATDDEAPHEVMISLNTYMYFHTNNAVQLSKDYMEVYDYYGIKRD